MNIETELLKLNCLNDALTCIQFAASDGSMDADIVGNALFAINSSMNTILDGLSEKYDSYRKAGACNE